MASGTDRFCQLAGTFPIERSEWMKLPFVQSKEARASDRNLIYKLIYLGCAIGPHLLVKNFLCPYQ